MTLSKHSFRDRSGTFKTLLSCCRARSPVVQHLKFDLPPSQINLTFKSVAMAVLKNIILAASVLAPLVVAIPMPGPHKRDIYTNWVTEIDWVTIEETTTVWVEPSATTPAPVADASATDVPAMVSDQATYTPTALQTLAAAPQAPPTSIPTVAPVAAYTPATQQAPAPSSSVVPIPAPAASSASPVSLIAPMVTLQPKATTGSDGLCQGSGDACQGDVTHWDGGK